MTDQIKNRVVGTIVIFAIAIIFLPDILDGKKQQLRDDFETIPVKPLYQAPNFDNSSSVGNIPETTAASNDVKDAITKKPPATTSPTIKKHDRKSEPTIATNSAVKQVTMPPSIKAAVKDSVKKVAPQRAWVITVGSFNDPANVKLLLTKLRKNGFTAFSVPSRPRKGEISKVYVGPSFSKQGLLKLQPTLKSVIDEPGYITAYNPNEK